MPIIKKEEKTLSFLSMFKLEKNSEKLTYFEQLQALTSCDEHLTFIESIIHNNLVSQSNKKLIVSQINQIKTRSLDNNFYLAVVGEFSSGKSTFINALLRDDLLKTSALVATACATKIKFGKDLTIEARLNGTEKRFLKTEETSSKITIPWLSAKAVTPKKLIHILTAEDSVAKNVVDLKISHPANFLKEGITIIDTPGTNAVNVEHGKITQKTIKNEADAIAIIIPATTPLSQTLANFLETSLHSFLHRCVFVVTKIDSIRRKERGILLNNLRRRLEEMLGIKNPNLLCVSSGIILDSLTGEEEISDEYEFWLKIFIHLENFLIKKLRQERILIISESLLRLLTQTLEQLEDNLTRQWQQYQKHELALQSEIIQDLNSFTIKQKKKCQVEVEKAIAITKNKIDYLILEYQEQKKRAIRETISRVTNWDQLKDVTQKQAELVLQADQNKLENDVNKHIQILHLKAEKTKLSFDEEFTKAYKKLQTLGASLTISENLNSNALSMNVSNVFSDMKNLQAEQETEAVNRVIKGAVIGVIGSILLPGIGTILAGVIGASMSRWFGPSLEERKNDLWNKLEPNLNIYFQQLKSQIQNDVATHGKELINSLDEHINLYVGKYKDVVDLILSEQQQQLEKLNTLQVSTKNFLQEIERRKKQIKKQQETLINSLGG